MSTPADSRPQRIALAVVAVPMLVQGAWMLVDPAGFHGDFLFGRGWVSAFGSYDQHLVRDVGSYALALGVVAAWAWWSMQPLLVRVTAVATLAAAIPHLLFHATHMEPFGAVDAAAQLLLLATQVIAPLAVLLLAGRQVFTGRVPTTRSGPVSPT